MSTTTKVKGEAQSARQTVAAIVLGVLFLGGAVWAFFYFRAPPQMGPDDDVFHAVDALYTAVTARNDRLLTQCEGKLTALKNEGKIPASAASYLDDVIATARAGNWRPAAERLNSFMKAQRREGAR